MHETNLLRDLEEYQRTSESNRIIYTKAYALLHALRLKDDATAEHCKLVAKYSYGLAKKFNLKATVKNYGKTAATTGVVQPLSAKDHVTYCLKSLLVSLTH